MKKFLLFVLLALGVRSAPANAQQAQAFVVTTCGTLATPYVAGYFQILTMDVTGKLCDGGGGGGSAYLNAPGSTLALGATFVKGTTAAMTGTTSTQIIALVPSNRIYVTRIKCNNSSATVSTLVQIQDGSGGTVLDTIAAADNFGGEQGVGTTPLFWTTSGNGLYAADVTTGASVICTASGYSG